MWSDTASFARDSPGDIIKVDMSFCFLAIHKKTYDAGQKSKCLQLCVSNNVCLDQRAYAKKWRRRITPAEAAILSDSITLLCRENPEKLLTLRTSFRRTISYKFP